MPLSFSASYCFSFLTLGRLPGIAAPLASTQRRDVSRRYPVDRGHNPARSARVPASDPHRRLRDWVHTSFLVPARLSGR
jgi:hypothetical protein